MPTQDKRIGKSQPAENEKIAPKDKQARAESERIAEAEQFAPEQKAVLVDKVHALAR